MPILAAISQDGGKDATGIKADSVDSMLLERNLVEAEALYRYAAPNPKSPPSPSRC